MAAGKPNSRCARRCHEPKLRCGSMLSERLKEPQPLSSYQPCSTRSSRPNVRVIGLEEACRPACYDVSVFASGDVVVSRQTAGHLLHLSLSAQSDNPVCAHATTTLQRAGHPRPSRCRQAWPSSCASQKGRTLMKGNPFESQLERLALDTPGVAESTVPQAPGLWPAGESRAGKNTHRTVRCEGRLSGRQRLDP